MQRSERSPVPVVRVRSAAVGALRAAVVFHLYLWMLAALPVASGGVVISEFMASNSGGIRDEDGDRSDWIELFNDGGSAVSLAGWALTDDPADLGKWEFPAVTLGAGEFLVVFASDKDRAVVDGELHTNFKLTSAGEYLALVRPDGATVEHDYAPAFPVQVPDVSYGTGLSVSETTLVPEGAAVRYLVPAGPGNDVGAGDGPDPWIAPGFADGGWTQGHTGIGYATSAGDAYDSHIAPDGDVEALMSGGGPSVYIRVPFEVADPSSVDFLTLRMKYDDGFVAYINGNPDPVADDRAPAGPDLAYDSIATDLHDDGDAVEYVDFPVGDFDLVAGTNWLCIHGLNRFNSSSDGLWSPLLVGGSATADGGETYFQLPSPGSPNSPGTGSPGPLVKSTTDGVAQPPAGAVAFTVTSEVAPTLHPVASVTLYYRVMFGLETAVVMRDDGVGVDLVGGDGVFSGEVSVASLGPGEMVRWRVSAADTSGAIATDPPYPDPADYPRYFGTVAQDPSAASSDLPVLHWFVASPSGAESSGGTSGSLYYLGEFYDNVHFDRHGQSTAGGNFPKKSFDVDFPKTNRFRWDPAGEAPRVKDINLLTNWADKSKVRHVLAYEIMREAGVDAHFAFTVRVQQNAEFFGTADFVEDADDRWLRRVGLNEDGPIYKAYSHDLTGSANSGFQKKNREEEGNADLQAFIDGLALPAGTQRKNFLFDNVDLPACVNMMAANSVIRNIDMHRKNWYIYCDTGRSDEWVLLPWDLDLSAGRLWTSTDTYFDNTLYTDGLVRTGTTLRLVQHMWSDPDIRDMLRRRLRTLCDRFLQAPGTPLAERYYERRLDEQLALIDPPGPSKSDAQLDFEKWGSWLQGGAQVPYTHTSPQVESMAEAIGRWKDEYLPARRDEIYNHNLNTNGGEIPSDAQPDSPSPGITITGLEFNPTSGNQDEEYIVLRNPTSSAVDISGWTLAEAVEFTFAGGTVIPPGKDLYVSPRKQAFRARATSPTGGQGRFVVGNYQGHLSSLGETVRLNDHNGVEVANLTYAGDPSDAQLYLKISEIMYHPAGDALAEFIELVNTSTTETLDLTGVQFVGGIEFDFTGGAVTSLAPGERVLVVRDLAAFEAAYGTAATARVAGVFANGTALSNGGEEIDLVDASGSTVAKFSYGDGGGSGSGWPSGPDGGGFSLVMIAPGSDPDPGIAASWRASHTTGGNPAGPDSVAFVGDPDGDDDGDGSTNVVEWTVSGTTTGAPAMHAEIAAIEVGGLTADYLVVTWQRFIPAEGVTFEMQATTDGSDWSGLVPHVGDVNHGDGTAAVVYRSAEPVSAPGRLLVRAVVGY